MLPEEINNKYTRFIDNVRRMREYQKKYFAYKAQSDLNNAKHYQREVDKFLSEETKIQKSKQPELFK